jgi:hypothetical protein
MEVSDQLHAPAALPPGKKPPGFESNWVHSALRPPIGLLCQPRVIMRIEKLVEWLAGETENTRKKPAPVPLCPPQTPHATGTRTRTATVGSQQLTAWATAWPWAPRIHWIGGWVGPRACLDPMKKRKIPCSCWEFNPGRPAGSSLLYRLSYPGSNLNGVLHKPSHQ